MSWPSAVIRFSTDAIARSPATRGGSLKQDRARISTPPGPPSKSRQVEPNEPKLSGFVFKTQAYTNPKHRDRIAFISVCACRFERGGKLNDGAEV